MVWHDDVTSNVSTECLVNLYAFIWVVIKYNSTLNKVCMPFLDYDNLVNTTSSSHAQFRLKKHFLSCQLTVDLNVTHLPLQKCI